MMNQQELESLRRISRSAGLAMLIWILVYVIITHCFIALKWDATDQTQLSSSSSLPTVNSIDSSSLVLENNVTTVIGDVLVNDTVDVDDDDELVQQEYTREEIQDLVQQLQWAINNNNNKIVSLKSLHTSMMIVMDEYDTVQKQLNETLSNPHYKDPSKYSWVPKLLKLKQLLRLGNVYTEVRSPIQFAKYVTAAINEIEGNLLLHSYDDPSRPVIDWTYYTNLFRNDTLPTKTITYQRTDDVLDSDSTSTVTGSCSSPPSTSSMFVDGLSYATQDDFSTLSQVLKDIYLHPWNELEKNSSAILVPVSFPETMTMIRSSLESFVEQMVQEINNVLSNEDYDDEDDDDDDDDVNDDNEDVPTVVDTSNFICLSNHDVNFWIDSGLDAYYRGYDAREALIRAMSEDFVPDTQTFILDADLSSNNNKNASQQVRDMIKKRKHAFIKNTRPKTLRQLLDIPAFYYTMSYLDPIIDTISGHHDVIDDILDKLVWSQLPTEHSNEPDIIARTAISTLYSKVGNVSIPKWIWDLPIFMKQL